MTADTDPTRDETLTGLFPVATADLNALHRRLEQAASASGLLDIAYRTLDTPVGTLLLAATDRGLVRVAYAREDFDAVLATLADSVSARVLRAPARLDAAAQQLDEYFAGARKDFRLSLDVGTAASFGRTVQSFLPRIAYGSTLTYQQVAETVGNPRAVRAVGSACAKNPLPVVVPCHRVIRSDGGLGGYVGGVDAKTTLLALERAHAAPADAATRTP